MVVDSQDEALIDDQEFSMLLCDRVKDAGWFHNREERNSGGMKISWDLRNDLVELFQICEHSPL